MLHSQVNNNSPNDCWCYDSFFECVLFLVQGGLRASLFYAMIIAGNMQVSLTDPALNTGEDDE